MSKLQAARASSGLTIWGLFFWAFKALWTGLIVLAPVFAAWVASSMAAHGGGSMRLAAASGLLVFPVLPVLWEIVARVRSKSTKPRVLTTLDRLILRTLFVSLLFVGVLLWGSPQRVFIALNARGDWMLDGQRDARAEQARRWIFRAAATSVWLYRLTDDNPLHDGRGNRPPPRPIERQQSVVGNGTATNNEPAPVVEAPRDARAWPWAETLHPAVQSLPTNVETSPESVGRYLAQQENDPWKLAKAVHDYVADRVAYDVPSYRSGRFPPQDAETTFRTRLSVCAGYSALFTAIGRAAGLRVETVVGRARNGSDTGMGEGHAWNAVQLDGRWYLVDTTWDAGSVSERFEKRYRTEYFLTPPEVFFLRHFPDDPKWQLLPAVRSEGEYLRAPIMNPAFFAQGLALLEPDRSEVDASGTFRVRVRNPQRRSLMASVSPFGGGAATDCSMEGQNTNEQVFTCTLPSTGTYQFLLFSAPRRFEMHWSVGSLRVQSR